MPNLPVVPKDFFNAVLSWSELLSAARQQKFVRLVLLSVGQWALDCKSESPTWIELREYFQKQLETVLAAHYEYVSRASESNNIPRCRLTQMRRVINCSAEDSSGDGRIPEHWLPAKLIVTSPPYPGVHVVYHRWQIGGRQETPAPFWLANSRDGAGSAFYCLGSRKERNLKTYFKRLGSSFSSIKALVDERSLVVQLVAFSQPEWQLPTYLSKMEEAGFAELKPICDKEYLWEGRIWRHVPGRKWYAKTKSASAASKE